MARWRCTNCGTVHRSNPTQCTNCGHTVFEQDRSVEPAADRDWVRLVGLLVLAAVILGGAVYVLLL
ncbi:MAG: hypothetical protein ABEJ58_00750 [Halodesulfurarchaeum sp.]